MKRSGAFLIRLVVIAGALQVTAPPRAAAQVHTPPPGSVERRAILDALRADMRRFDPKPVVFVVRHLRVRGGWAWLEVNPQSPDGRSRYEPEGALMRRGERRRAGGERLPGFGEGGGAGG